VMKKSEPEDLIFWVQTSKWRALSLYD